MRVPIRLALAVTSAVLVAALPACVVIRGPIEQVTGGPKRSAEPTTAIDWTGSHGRRVLVLGHEFARDWFAHWGWQGSGPVARQGVSLYLGDLDRAPKGAAAVRKHVAEAPDGVLVVFAAGPEALKGGSAKAASASARKLLAEVDTVTAAARARGVKVVVLGPLPSLLTDTDRHLVAAQEAYAAGLRARERKDVLRAFDAREPMSTPGEVTLVRGYARTQTESRLGPAGFEALDEAFFPFVRKRF